MEKNRYNRKYSAPLWRVAQDILKQLKYQVEFEVDEAEIQNIVSGHLDLVMKALNAYAKKGKNQWLNQEAIRQVNAKENNQ